MKTKIVSDQEVEVSNFNHGAFAGEKCEWCREEVNEGAHRCAACGATRHLSPDKNTGCGYVLIMLSIFALLITMVFGGFYILGAASGSPRLSSLMFLVPFGVFILLVVTGAIKIGTGKKVVVWRTDRK